MENIKSYLILLEEEIKKSTNGHLPLEYRVKLMHKIDNVSLVNKIFYSCVLKIRQLKNGIFSENEILDDILFKTKEFLYNNKGSKEDFRNLFNKYRNYLNEYDAIGWLLLSLCNNIITDAAFILNIDEYDGSDDSEYDFEVWTPDFFAAMIFSGGNPFVDKNVDDIKKRKLFWLWYIGIVEEVCKNPNIEISPFIYKKKMETTPPVLFRNQIQLDDKIRTEFDIILTSVLKQTSVDIKWDYINMLFVSCIGSMLDIYYSTGERVKLSTETVNYICNKFRDIRKNMYVQHPKEGAWFQVKILINRDGSYTLGFNYDEFDEIPSTFQEPDWILRFFRNFPRSKEYTPQWLQKIVGKKVKYLK